MFLRYFAGGHSSGHAGGVYSTSAGKLYGFDWSPLKTTLIFLPGPNDVQSLGMTAINDSGEGC